MFRTFYQLTRSLGAYVLPLFLIVSSEAFSLNQGSVARDKQDFGGTQICSLYSADDLSAEVETETHSLDALYNGTWTLCDLPSHAITPKHVSTVLERMVDLPSLPRPPPA